MASLLGDAVSIQIKALQSFEYSPNGISNALVNKGDVIEVAEHIGASLIVQGLAFSTKALKGAPQNKGGDNDLEDSDEGAQDDDIEDDGEGDAKPSKKSKPKAKGKK